MLAAQSTSAGRIGVHRLHRMQVWKNGEREAVGGRLAGGWRAVGGRRDGRRSAHGQSGGPAGSTHTAAAATGRVWVGRCVCGVWAQRREAGGWRAVGGRLAGGWRPRWAAGGWGRAHLSRYHIWSLQLSHMVVTIITDSTQVSVFVYTHA